MDRFSSIKSFSSGKMALTNLQKRILTEIVAHVRRENFPVGTHVPESFFAKSMGTARSPIRIALAQLEKLGVVHQQPTRGYFLAVPASSLSTVLDKLSLAAEDKLYQQIAEARLNRKLPDDVTEMKLMRMFGATSSKLHKTLARILQEGWVERRYGHGWSFLPMIDSRDAFIESTAFRRLIEPAAILEPTFNPPPDDLAACRKQQEFITEEGYKVMTPTEFWSANAHFHEKIAAWSGNRFILLSIRRLNQLRRLLGYRNAEVTMKERMNRKAYHEEHLDILAKIADKNFMEAANLMRKHIDDAQLRLVKRGLFPSEKP